MTAFVHLAERLDRVVTAAHFRAAFPSPCARAFVLAGGGAPASRPELDRFQFFGAEPVATFTASRLRETRGEKPLARITVDADSFDSAEPFAELRRFFRAHAVPEAAFDPRYPFPFRAGAVGYVGYECGQFLERLPRVRRPSIGTPDLALSMHRWVVATSEKDSAGPTSWLSVVGVGSDQAAARRDAEATWSGVTERLRRPPPLRAWASPTIIRSAAPRAALGREEYLGRVADAKAHIEAGDAFEICLTNALSAPLADELAWELFDELSEASPAPFAALLHGPDGIVVSSSPERFLSVDARRRVESRPIKGTRPRGRSAEEDRALAAELAASEKDRAENAMIVDLMRNDLGRVCRVGSVVVPELYAIESYATVHQMVSTIQGDLAPEHDAIDLLAAAFPPGSMTGAPKIEAMSILEHLEPVERGVYAGALGWFDAAGALDLSVVIRTAVVKDGTATFSVGGAVVADSDPALEHEETLHKARAVAQAIGVVVARQRRGDAA